MEDIIRFVTCAQSDRFTLTEPRAQFSISRQTGYKYLSRSVAAGLSGIAARSRRPHPFPQRTTEEVEKLILAERRLRRTGGSKTLHHA